MKDLSRQEKEQQEKQELITLEINRLFNEVNAGFFCRDIITEEYIYLSAGCEKIYGYSIGEFQSNMNLWFEVIHPDDRHIVQKDDELMNKGIQIFSEYRIIHKDQTIRWIEIKVVPVIIDTKLCRIEGIINDITERKKAIEEKEKITADLVKRNTELRQFSYIISHDLRSPISKILGLVSLLDKDQREGKLNEELIGYIQDEAANLDNVVKDLNTLLAARDISSEYKNEMWFEKELSYIKRSLINEIKESQAVILSDFSDTDHIFTIRSFVYSIMYNLLSNAIKYRSPERPLVIHIGTCTENSFVCLSVQDNGVGIDLQKYGEKLFGLYSRFHLERAPGKGMGLNLVKTQAETLGGRVTAESQPGIGSVFKVFLPKS